MTPRIVSNWLGRLGLVGGAALVLSGCPEEAANITESASEPSQDFALAGAYIEPAGAFLVDNIVFSGNFDPDATPDAFARGGEPFGFGWAGPGNPRYNITSGAHNMTTDPRLPALGGLGTEVTGDAGGGGPFACRFGDDGFWGGPAGGISGYDFFCFLVGLKPNTDYSVLLVRYALTVNGTLDTEEILLTGAITQPDQLTLASGAPGGYPNEECLFSTAVPAFTVGVTANTNPFNMGFVTTDAAGSLVFDCLIGTGGLWQGTLLTTDGAPFAPNDIAFSTLPRYNYVIVVEGQGTAMNPVPTGPTVMRFQVGVDLVDASGAPVSNGLAPLPDDSLTFAELGSLPGAISQVDSLTMLYNNLEALAGGAEYELWLVNPDSGTAVKGVGTYRKIQIVVVRDELTGGIISETDSVVDSIFPTSSFTGDASGDGFRHEMIIGDGTMPGGAMDTIGFYDWAVLTVTASPGGATMPETRPLFYKYTALIPGGATSFGNFAGDSIDNRFYAGSGQGTGGVRAGSVFSVDLQALSRPPIGYVLSGWIVGIPSPGAPIPTEGVTGPLPVDGSDPVDLADADVTLVDGVVTENGVLNANFRLDVSPPDTVDFTQFGFFMMTVEPKLGIAGMGPIPVQMGELPKKLTTPPEE